MNFANLFVLHVYFLTLTDFDFLASKSYTIDKVKESQRQKVSVMKISDSVANYILELLETDHGSAEIQRNELANILGCVPSQINYVITSRFTPEQGYIVVGAAAADISVSRVLRWIRKNPSCTSSIQSERRLTVQPRGRC